MQQTPFDTSQFTRNPAFAPLWSALEAELATGKRTIYLWDANHGSIGPRAIMADGGLYDVASRYGRPFYVTEALSGQQMVERYLAGDPAERAAIRDRLYDLSSGYVRDPEQLDAYAAAIIEPLRMAKVDVIDLLGPDPRADQPLPEYTEGERAIASRFMDFLHRQDSPSNLTQEAVLTFMNGSTETERQDFRTYMEKLRAFALPGTEGNVNDTSVTDHEINRRIDAHRTANGITEDRVQVVLYGAGHFTKMDDLDEARPGVSVIVMDRPGDMGGLLGKLLRMDDRPDYVWYAAESRLAKLDTPEAMQEMLGMGQAAPQSAASLPLLPAETRSEQRFR